MTFNLTPTQKLKRFISNFLPLGGWKAQVAVHRGLERVSGHPSSVLTVGGNRIVGYIPHRFFDGDTRVENLGKVSLWKLPSLLEQLQPQVDLTALVLDRWSVRWLPKQPYLTSPTWVASWMPITNEFEERKLSKLNRSMSRDMAYVRNNRFTYEVSRNMRDLNLFYDRYYHPYITRRHDTLSGFMNRYEAMLFLRQGHLVWLKRDGVRVAGALIVNEGKLMKLVILGIADGDTNLLRGGTISALYYYAIQHGKKNGQTAVFYGGSRPSLHDGVFRFKRKWGAVLCEHPGINYEMLLHWSRMDGVVANFLSHTSIIYYDNGNLSALWVYPGNLPLTADALMSEYNHIHIPGLHGMSILLPDNLPAGVNLSGNIRLINYKSQPISTLNLFSN